MIKVDNEFNIINIGDKYFEIITEIVGNKCQHISELDYVTNDWNFKDYNKCYIHNKEGLNNLNFVIFEIDNCFIIALYSFWDLKRKEYKIDLINFFEFYDGKGEELSSDKIDYIIDNYDENYFNNVVKEHLK